MSIIRTYQINPPIPVRCFDWQANLDDYEPGQPIGFGKTERDAIIALLDEVADRKADEEPA